MAEPKRNHRKTLKKYANQPAQLNKSHENGYTEHMPWRNASELSNLVAIPHSVEDIEI
jgi:hypothetical protein